MSTTATPEKLMALEWLMINVLKDTFRKADGAPAAVHYFAADADMHWSEKAQAALLQGDTGACARANRIRLEVRGCLDAVLDRLDP
ncbi:hypothetical protein NS226_21100 [Aureimonas ureilytica]|uniref:Uncharacterized protein n=1 Tax=Aureimonas ureilytica TaxID=401562 RepID=A0A175R4X0_9HYPH|nr:hypothetical protein [Aureimonas ureilytica]KTQ85091.1 hypothetical protein NS226_21100 [Aureimonas ureilytica]